VWELTMFRRENPHATEPYVQVSKSDDMFGVHADSGSTIHAFEAVVEKGDFVRRCVGALLTRS
jgi:hypothetical protein